MVSLLTLFAHFLFLLSDLQLRSLAFDVFVVLLQRLRDVGLGNSDRDDLDSGCPLVTVMLQSFGQLFIQRVELFNEDLLQGVSGAELVDLVTKRMESKVKKGKQAEAMYLLNLVENPRCVIVGGVVLDGLVRELFLEPIHNFNLVKLDKDST